jgi:predicted glycoside hydrolase/deacetylase ChbG (UPF0249 family)
VSGLLIVNADDWGLDPASTDAIAAVHARGAITSASAMVFEQDSERAASLAGPPLGLHLNVSDPYTGGPEVPAAVRERQARLAARLQRLGTDPRLAPLARDVVADQRARFEDLYGRSPDHVDGHRHMHLAPAVLLYGGLVKGERVRRSFTFRPGDKPPHNRALRATLNAYLARRFTTTRWFFALGHDAALQLAERDSVEVMTHPVWEGERRLLESDGWAQALARLRLGSYADL